MQITFPALTIPAFKMVKGQLLNLVVFGAGLVIPPVDITFWEAVKLTDPFVIFDSDELIAEMVSPLFKVADFVWDIAEARLDIMAEKFYKEQEEE